MTDLHKLGTNVIVVITLDLLKKGPIVILLYNTTGLTTVKIFNFIANSTVPEDCHVQKLLDFVICKFLE
jgi:hypothetical protein